MADDTRLKGLDDGLKAMQENQTRLRRDVDAIFTSMDEQKTLLKEVLARFSSNPAKAPMFERSYSADGDYSGSSRDTDGVSIPLQEISSATNDFAKGNKIGSGGYGLAKISDFGLSKLVFTNSTDSVIFIAACGTAGNDRPTMSLVVKAIEKALDYQQASTSSNGYLYDVYISFIFETEYIADYLGDALKIEGLSTFKENMKGYGYNSLVPRLEAINQSRSNPSTWPSTLKTLIDLRVIPPEELLQKLNV
ncbi:hypothetical protein L1987_51706 [Smallanthus sonchifolius]|uniref:Uncharacterized protein n=1 Tax=Smallanthus sonchifolius TaxID=185202 RepID=A0ACB9EQR6_9ASTR|nr:hypothetical protein L1987_51706 [Smallanthus sonchifolius]